jgi:hypothetical protein
MQNILTNCYKILIQVRFWFQNNKNDFRKFFEKITIVFYLEDWIYKEDYAFEINQALSEQFLWKVLESKNWKKESLLQEPFCIICPKHNIIKYNI